MSSIQAFLLDCSLQTAKLLTTTFRSDGPVPLKQFIMDNPIHIAQNAAPSAASLLEPLKPFLGCSFSNRVFAVESTNVSGSLCSFGTPIELVKKEASEMFLFLNLTLHSFGPENFVPLFQIPKFQKGLIDEKGGYKMLYYK
jgi:hypothetical protein